MCICWFRIQVCIKIFVKSFDYCVKKDYFTSGVFFGEFDGRMCVIHVSHEFGEVLLTVWEDEKYIVDVTKI